MAETSYYWDGTTLGDATNAPYSDTAEIHGMLETLLGNFVIPEYLNSLELISDTPALGSVSVKSGAAFVKGAYYTSTASVSVAITAAVNNRFDRFVLRYDSATQIVRVTKIIGAEAANPSLPALGANDLAIGYIWIPAGYNPAITAISTNDIHDERVFRHLGLTETKYSREDVMPNGEFVAFSQTGVGAVPPETWRVVAGVPVLNTGAYVSTLKPRGHKFRIQGGAGVRIATTLYSPYIAPSGSTTVYTVKGLLYLTSGSVSVSISNRVLGGATGGGIGATFNNTGVEIPFLFRWTASVSNAIEIELIIAAAGTDFQVGQIMVVQGWCPGPFRPKSEWIMYDGDNNDAAWTTSPKSTGITSIDMTANFNSCIRRSTRALLARLRGNDSGSAGAGPYYLALDSPAADYVGLRGRADCGFLANDTIREALAFCPFGNHNANPPTMRANVVASGAGTLDATIQPVGIIT